jgi:hypothetical protein
MLSKAQIVQLLATNDNAIARALIVLNNNQTADEQRQETVKYRNGMGFRPCHARMGTSMAQFFEKRNFLTPKQIAYWRKPDAKGSMKIAIYWRQLAEAAESKRAVTPAPTDDVGNMAEELMVLEERFQDYQDSDDFPKLERMQEKIALLKKEIARAMAEQA